jgi:hypothetical protein
MILLPTEIENIIYDYKNQLEHYEKFQLTLDIINQMEYKIKTTFISERKIKHLLKEVEYNLRWEGHLIIFQYNLNIDYDLCSMYLNYLKTTQI